MTLRVVLGLVGVALGCASSGGTRTAPAPTGVPTRDSSRILVPAGYGSLRQDDIAIRLQAQGLQVRALPLDESVIRLLSPDSYRALRELVASQKTIVEASSSRAGLRGVSLWYVQFFGLQPGETRFSPLEFIITSVGRDFRPIEVFPVTAGFGEQRLRQRETQAALYAFDPQIDVNQPLSVQYESERSDDWTTVLPRIERERALVLSRAGIKGSSPR
jgi:hypothetical protein